MHSDIVELREFYQSPLGQTARRLLRDRLRSIWPSLRGETVLALGYGTPLLRPYLNEVRAVTAFMPAAQGVSYWPREGPNISSLTDIGDLPLADNSIDRVILMHGLEGSAAPHKVLGEIWRIMKSGGRLLVMVPNRRGLWAHSDSTPFGSGEPYSSSQIKRALRDQGFLVDRTWQALYLPPSPSRLTLSLADTLEKYGEKLFPKFGGLHVMEAGKQLYATVAPKTRSFSQRLILPLPTPAGSPLPAGRVVT